MNVDVIENILPQIDDIGIIIVPLTIVRKCDTCQELFVQALGAPGHWWDEFLSNEPGLSSAGYFGCEELTDEDGDSLAHVSWLRSSIKDAKNIGEGYKWETIEIFTHWSTRRKRSIVAIFSENATLSDQFAHELSQNVKASNDPFWVYPRIFGVISRLQSRACHEIQQSKELLVSPGRYVPHEMTLYNLWRNATVIAETIEINLCSLSSILAQHGRFVPEPEDRITASRQRLMLRKLRSERSEVHQPRQQLGAEHTSRQVQDRLLYFQQVFRGYGATMASIKELLRFVTRGPAP
ncbi:hypothetical protein PFICI_04093 [Pestalotiopsis fici W106-1]|uniref:Uncharacterized protein n=1 Tax=Pestalotiopsis fici (strain W106-1 / CGMCC3.15140) TaxID=1229662 RepID=W3XJ26_PESFW|nr:uncharacterized protein PFICI_04093 [Pestalotiopsis fici W106-1]ETS86068.1 hypothetical protein PFICI_04093 [Pestalotiopsis fici W106-1]